ncbi:hypothetical protein [Streptomyces sp. BE133]|uniref:hypothetical protein n=1 Tax=Streptomyces sp. BE133 TaxID=3002523 RepID=UPI002E7856E8|nr:hypothetical protein [Streptomyces sp. BE133]MEE1808968.1 hypothetical protein [Streptomyces sp. BE133]
MTDTGTPPGSPRSLEARVHIPAAGPADLRDAVREALGAVHAPPAPPGTPTTAQWYRTTSGDWGMAANGLRAEVGVSWDGPDLRIVGSVDTAGPAAITRVLSDTARRLPGGPQDRLRHASPTPPAGVGDGNTLIPCIPPPEPAVSAVYRLPSELFEHAVIPSPAAAAHLALSVMLRAPDTRASAEFAVLTDNGCAQAGSTAAWPRPCLVAESLDLGPSVTVAEVLARRRQEHRHPHGRPTRPRPAFVFDCSGPPAVPDGWLLQSWTYLVADAVHCSLSGAEGRYRLRAEAPRNLVRQPRLNLLVALWADALTTLVTHQDRPLDSLDILGSAAPYASA